MNSEFKRNFIQSNPVFVGFVVVVLLFIVAMAIILKLTH